MDVLIFLSWTDSSTRCVQLINYLLILPVLNNLYESHKPELDLLCDGETEVW